MFRPSSILFVSGALLASLFVRGPVHAQQAQEAQEAQEAPRVLQATGSFFSRYELRRGYNDLGRNVNRFRDFDAVAYRARLNLDTQPLSISDTLDITMRFSPQASGFWAAGTGSGALQDAALGLHEGYLKLFYGLSWLQVGRFEMNYGEQFFIGAVGWHQTARSFDGGRWRLIMKENSWWLDLFVVQTAEGLFTAGAAPTASVDPGAGDFYLLGAYAALGPLLAPGLALDVYELVRVAPPTDADDGSNPGGTQVDGAVHTTTGVRAVGTVGSLDYRAEAGLQAGSMPGAPDIDVLAYQGDVEVGVKLLEGRFRAGLEGFFASGDDPETADKNEGWLDNLSTAHKWIGLMDIMGTRTNVAGGVLHLMGKPVDRLKLLLQQHLFLRPYIPSSDPGFATKKFKAVGTETNLVAIFAVAKGLAFRADWGLFMPFEDGYGAGADPAHMLMLQFGYNGP